MFKRITSIISAIAVTISIMPFSLKTIAADERTSPNNAFVSAEGTNQIGDILSSELNSSLAEQSEDQPYNIISVDMDNNTAKVEYEAEKDCTLIVGIYSEDESRLIASGNAELSCEEETIDVDINSSDFPKYFCLKAYMIDTETLRPLSDVYESSLYTEDMQRLSNQTINDFDEDRALNLDDDINTNFVVIKESVNMFESNSAILANADNEKLVYTFESPDEKMTSLSVGDIFTYKGEDDLLVIKIADKKQSDGAITFYGEEISPEDVFECIKIDYSSDTAEFDNEEYEENQSNKQNENDVSRRPAPKPAQIGGQMTAFKQLKCVFVDVNEETKSDVLNGEEDNDDEDDDNNEENKKNKRVVENKIGISGSISFTVKADVKWLMAFTHQYLKFELSYAAKFELKYSNSITAELKLPSIEIINAGVVAIKIDLYLVGEINGSIEYSNTLSGSIGIKAEHKGIKYFSLDNISKHPKSESKFECKADTFIGLKIKPNIKVKAEVKVKFKGMNLKVINLKGCANVSAKVGVRAKVANNDPYIDTALGRIHECKICFEGDISAELSIGCEVSFRDWKRARSFGPYRKKITDFHYSQTFNEFGFTKCGHCQYRLAVEVYDENGNPIKYASVQCGGGEGTTNEDGIVTMFSERGEQEIHVSAYGYIDSNTTININAPIQTTVTLYKKPDLGDNKKNVFNYNGHSYCVFDNVVNTFDDAINYCHKLGGYLLVINDAKENAYVYEKMTAQGIDSAYFGYKDKSSEGSWKWLDRDSSYENWASGEPNGKTSENYGMFYWKFSDGKWNDGDFDTHTVNGGKAFICEWDYIINPDDPTQVTPKPVSRKLFPNIDTDAYALNVMENESEIETNTISASYSDLIPDEVYNFYLVKSKETDSVISSDNLFYITQAVADKNGDLTINYAPIDEPNAEKLLVGMKGTDISKAKVIVEDLKYTGKEQFCKVNVTYEGQELVKGKDYYVCNDIIAKECGDYSVFIEGCGAYSGGITAEYKVIQDDNESISSSEEGTDISANTTTTTITADTTSMTKAATTTRITTSNGATTILTSSAMTTSKGATTIASAPVTTTGNGITTTTTVPVMTTGNVSTTTATVPVTTTGIATTTTISIVTPITYTLGDVNNDKQINAVDASSVLAYYAMISTNQDGRFDEEQKLAADVNHDGLINAVDASNILSYYAYVSTTKETPMSMEEYMKKN
ncbi:lectin-like protein [Ruminococcus sp.]|uniref:lectin-like protein n=1 Tax=Ruminococcus sp. TaxID=41978 RepID=UPI0025ED1185|nr:lectin-like protein [Ruminococcus sp.]MCR4638498.1 hypothetical protein [Ruminococcus sp.]